MKAPNKIKDHHRRKVIMFMLALGIYIIIDEWDIFDFLFAKEYSKPVVTMLLAAPKAFSFWLFKKNAAQDESNNNQQKQDTIFWETLDAQDQQADTHFWESLAEAQETFAYKKATEVQKTAAIYKTGVFYAPQHDKFVTHIHALFKDCLEEFWENNTSCESASDFPKHIEVIYNIIKHQSHKEKDGKKLFEKVNGLSFVDFQLKLANFNYINFSNANLIHVNLLRASLSNADLVNADLANAELGNVDLTDANLTNANLLEADLANSILYHANLSKANCSGANFPSAHLPRANLTRTNLKGADLTHTDLTEADLTHAPLEYVNLTKANLTRANLIGADLGFANLSSANFIDAILNCANLTKANLDKTDFTRANLIGVDLRNTRNLTKAKLEGAMYCESKYFVTQFPEGFDPEAHGMRLVDKHGNSVKK